VATTTKKVTNRSAHSQVIKKQVRRSLSKVQSADEAQAIAEELTDEFKQVVETTPEEIKPGMTLNGNKVPFTYKYLCEIFPIVSFIPDMNIKFTYQGVPVQLYAGIECHIPKIYKDLYDRPRAINNDTNKTLREMGITPELGAGSLG